MKAIQIYLLLFSNGFQCIIYLINKLIAFVQSCSTSTTTNSGPRPRGTIQLSPWLFWYACSCILIKLQYYIYLFVTKIQIEGRLDRLIPGFHTILPEWISGTGEQGRQTHHLFRFLNH